MDKNIIKETMLSLEGAAFQSAREKYFDYVADARLDRSETIENDKQAQAEIASDLSEALDDTLHDHADKLDKLREVDFGPKSAVTEGALVRLSGRYFLIAVYSTSKFTCDGREVMGISTMAPIFGAMGGARAGETVEFNGRKLVIEDVGWPSSSSPANEGGGMVRRARAGLQGGPCIRSWGLLGRRSRRGCLGQGLKLCAEPPCGAWATKETPP